MISGGADVVEEAHGGCWGPTDPPEGLSLSCLELLRAVDITSEVLEGNFFVEHPLRMLQT